MSFDLDGFDGDATEHLELGELGGPWPHGDAPGAWGASGARGGTGAASRPRGDDLFVRLEGEAGEAPVVARLAAGAALVVGACPEADVVVRQRGVSRRHARLEHLGVKVLVTDLGSKNGVFCGGARLRQALVPVGALVELGETRLWIEAPGDAVGCGAPGDRADAAQAEPLAGLLGRSRAMRVLAGHVRRVAPLKLSVLLRGETGTGKDLVARALHDESRRAAGPYVALNCATVARELAESELFGHVRGAFTGASRDRKGAFREAHRGTLFLDEIAALPLDVQAKLLRAVEEGSVRPLGGEEQLPVDVRLVAATCEPLEEMVLARRFRGDLYERLATCVVQVPALRHRREDVPLLARHLLAQSGVEGRTLSGSALARLQACAFPGNVRELRNVVVQAALRADAVVGAEHVAAVLAERSGSRRKIAPAEALRFYEAAHRNVSEAARRAELPRSTMRDLLRAAGVREAPREASSEGRPA